MQVQVVGFCNVLYLSVHHLTFYAHSEHYTVGNIPLTLKRVSTIYAKISCKQFQQRAVSKIALCVKYCRSRKNAFNLSLNFHSECMYICVYMCMYIYIHIYIYTYIYIYFLYIPFYVFHLYIFLHVYLYVFIILYFHIFIHFCFSFFYFNFSIICVSEYVLLYMWLNVCVGLYVNVCKACLCFCILSYLLWQLPNKRQGMLTQWPAPDPMG